MKSAIFTLICLQTICPAAIPTLHFGDPLTWKSIFDSGFRPKYVPGLEIWATECKDQAMILKFPDKPGFLLDRGRVKFELQSDDSIRILAHVGRVPITMDEGAKRLEDFRNLFGGDLQRRGSIPPLMDEVHGGVMSSSENDAVAKSSGFVVFYGFISAYDPKTPLLPVLTIGLDMDMESIEPPIRTEVIKPPAGYEWYSLDPKVSTPDPGTAAAAAIATKPAAAPPPRPRKTTTSRLPSHGEAARGAPFRWWIPLLVVLAGVIAVVVARRAFR